MPNRILRESICTSHTLDSLKPEEEVFFYRLIVICDDYGRMDANPTILAAKCFPLKIRTLTDLDILAMLQSLVRVGLVEVYEDNCERYLHLKSWDKCQQVRAKRSRYPAPGEEFVPVDGIICKQMISNDINCNHLQANDSPILSYPIQSNPIQSNPKDLGRTEKSVKDEPEKEPIPYEEILAYLNKKTSRAFRVGKGNRDLIRARWKDGYRLADFEKVIDNMAAAWMGDPKMENFLRPETLFQSQQKFDGYLNWRTNGRPREDCRRTDIANTEFSDDDTFIRPTGTGGEPRGQGKTGTGSPE